MRILYVVGRWPWPPRRGDRLRTTQLLAALGRRADLTLLAPRPAAGDEPAPTDLAARLVTWNRGSPARVPRAVVGAALAGRPLQSALFHHPRLGEQLRRLAPSHDLTLLSLVRLVGHLPDLAEARLACDFIDSLALNLARRARWDLPPFRPLLRLEQRRLERAEALLLDRAEVGFVVAEPDRQAIASRVSPRLGSRLSVVPLAVAPAASVPRSPGPPRIVLTGNLGYFPNRDAAAWLLDAVWPRLSARRPELQLFLAGARPSARLRRECRRRGARLVADPPDLRQLLATASVALAPLRAGSGVPIKILEAWAVGVPVVASPLATVGAGASPGLELLQAHTPDEWVDAVESLLDHPVLAHALVQAGRAALEERHSPASLEAALESSGIFG